MASEWRPASRAARAAARRRRRNFMWLRSWETCSASVSGARGGVEGGGGGFVESPEKGMLEREKLSSDQQTLSRRNAAVASRFPVWRRTIASSIRPRWQHA